MKKVKHKTEPIILLALSLIYLIVLFKITIFRESNSGVQSVNLIPFITIAEYFRFILNGNIFIGISNILGNLIIFLPLGYISALLFPKIRKHTKIFILAFVFSLAIEVLQYILACGRADIDDVILNTIGGVAGYWIYILTSRFLKSKKHTIFISASMIMVACIGFITFSNYRFLVDRPARSELPVLAETIAINEQQNTHLTNSAVTNIDFNTNLLADAQSAADETAWSLILINKWNYIPDDYEVELTVLTNGQKVDKRIYPALQKMFDSARNDGVYPNVLSGYRTAEIQQSLLDEKIADYKTEGYSAEEAVTKAETWVAIPGTSEHQLGIAVDINADGIHSTGYEVYEWLGQNAYKFGFICRYPPGKTEITGIINEPWHYRYVGIKAAAEIQTQGFCLEEYLNKVN